MSRLDELRALRERQAEAKAKRPLGQPKPAVGATLSHVTENPHRVTENVTENKPVTENVRRARGRPRKPDALSDAERQRRRRAKPQPGGENG